MRIEWKSFDVCLPAFGDMLKSIENTDGIVATEKACYVIEKQPISDSAKNSINTYWAGLSEEGEVLKDRDRELAKENADRQAAKAYVLGLIEDNK